MVTEQQAELQKRILDEAIRPRVDEITEVWEQGGIALVFFEPGDELEAFAAEHGWPDNPVKRLPREMAERLKEADPITRQWLERAADDVVRIFLCIHHGTLLVNFHPDRGFWIEPNSTDGPVV